MRIVEHNPDNSCKWKLLRSIDPMGRTTIHTGRVVQENNPQNYREHTLAGSPFVQELCARGYRVDLVQPRVTVWAELRPSPTGAVKKHYQIFEDRNNPDMPVLLNVIAVREALAMVMDGTIEVRDGWMRGNWTFGSNSGQISLYPQMDQRRKALDLDEDKIEEVETFDPREFENQFKP